MARDEAMAVIEKLEAKYGSLWELGLTGFSIMSREDYILYAEAQKAVFN